MDNPSTNLKPLKCTLRFSDLQSEIPNHKLKMPRVHLHPIKTDNPLDRKNLTKPQAAYKPNKSDDPYKSYQTLWVEVVK